MTTDHGPQSQTLASIDIVDYDAVRVGEELPPITFEVTAADVEDYRTSVGSSVGSPVGLPMPHQVIANTHLLAITMAAITERMPLPATCVHVGQELEWHCGVQADAAIDVRFALVSRRTAGDRTLSAFSFHLASAGQPIARGRILLQS